MTAPVMPEGPEWQVVRDAFTVHHRDRNQPGQRLALMKESELYH